jgi:molybdate transport system substrate-binding protein
MPFQAFVGFLFDCAAEHVPSVTRYAAQVPCSDIAGPAISGADSGLRLILFSMFEQRSAACFTRLAVRSPRSFSQNASRTQENKKMRFKLLLLAGAVAVLCTTASEATELKLLTAGAFKSTVLALLPDYEKTSGNKVSVENDTVGALIKRIKAGESFDVVVMTPEGVDQLTGEGKVISGSGTNLARVGVGVMVKTGANKPDISTVDAFKKAVLEAKSISFIDPASGGSSGIYVEKLLERLGISDQVKPKEKLKQGGYVADYVASGEAELGIHQISEILPHGGVTLVGPLPKEIQNYTVYAAGIGTGTQNGDAAKALIASLVGPSAQVLFKSKGMEPGGN